MTKALFLLSFVFEGFLLLLLLFLIELGFDVSITATVSVVDGVWLGSVVVDDDVEASISSTLKPFSSQLTLES